MNEALKDEIRKIAKEAYEQGQTDALNGILEILPAVQAKAAESGKDSLSFVDFEQLIKFSAEAIAKGREIAYKQADAAKKD